MSISDLIERHQSRLTRTLNLVASENLLSADVKRALACDMAMRYCIPPEGERPAAIWDYPNQDVVRRVAAEAESLAKALFHAAYADLRPLSGNQVAQIVLMSVVQRGDTVWSVPARCGGHFATAVIADKAGLNLIPIPYDHATGVIDVDRARDLAKRHPPRLVFLDASMQVFPHPLAELREAIGPGPILSYDASHTLGLIAGGAFQSPLREGADLLHGSTHKTLWGPQKGLILAREMGPVSGAIHDGITPFFVSNIHVHHVAALGVALEESRDFGAAYARTVIGNARHLAASLVRHGVDVLFAERGATECHQVLVDIGEREASLAAWSRLQAAGLHVNAIALPFRETYGLRIGVAEVTRRGLGAAEMEGLAGWIAACIAGSGAVDRIAAEVADLSGRFSTLHFSNQPTPIGWRGND